MNWRFSVLRFLKKTEFFVLFVSFFIPRFMSAQVADFEFEHDTVCVNDPINVYNYSSGALTYQWIFESAIITPEATVEVIPDVTIPLDVDGSGGPVYIDAVRDGEDFYTFVAKHKGNAGIWIQEYGNSFDNSPVNWEIVSIPTPNIEGLDIEKGDDGIYYGIICGGTGDNMFRISFINGINTAPVLVENIGQAAYTAFPHDINLVKQDGIWYAIISNSNPSWRGENIALTIMKFNDGLGGDPITIDAWSYSPNELGLINANLQGIATIKIDGQWYAMVTSTTGYLLRVEFNDDFTQARAINLGDINGTLDGPRDISIVSDCGMLSGFVVNVGDNSLGILHFDDGITGDVWGEKKDFDGVYAYPHAISDIYRFGGDAIVIIPEVIEGKLIKFKFTPSGGHVNIPFPDPTDFEPTFSYDTANTYYLSLSINSDIASTVCKGIVVIDKPLEPVISSDPVCKGDSLNLALYDHPDANYHWTYPDNSTSQNKYPLVNNPGIYKLYLSYGACFSPEASENVSILQLPDPNVLPDPAEVCQWEYLQLFGNAIGGNPPYVEHSWTGYGDNLFDTLTISDPNFMGRMGIEEEDYYLSDLPWISINYSNRPPQTDKNVEGNVLFLQFFMDKGIGMESETEVTYLTNGYYDHFRSRVGINDAIACGTVEFLVYAGDSLLFNSGVVSSSSMIQSIDIPISAFDSITLKVQNGGDDDFCDIADWGNARFVKNPPRLSYDLIYEVTDTFGCRNADTALVSVDTNDVHIYTQPYDTSVCPGEAATLMLNAYGPAVIDYQWQIFNGTIWADLVDGGSITGSNNDSLNVFPVAVADEGQYRCVMATLPCGKDTSDVAEILVKPVPEITDTVPSSTCGLGVVTLSATTSLGEIQWYDVSIGGIALDTSNIFIDSNVTETKTYYLQPEASGCGAVSRTPITAYYYEFPVIDSLIYTHSSLCELTDGALQIFAHGTTSFEHSIDNGNIWQAGNLFPGLLMGLYDVAVRYDNGLCVSYMDSTAQIKSLAAPLISDVSYFNETDCGMDNGQITVSVSGGTGFYEYSNDGGSSWQTGNIFPGLTPADYQIAIRNSDSTCLVEYASIIVIDGYDEPIIISVVPNNVSDCDSSDGSIIISASGTSNQLVFSVDSGLSWFITNTFSDLSPNDYYAAVSYINGTCVTFNSTMISITQPKRPIIDSLEVFPVINCFPPDGHITIEADSGEGAYEYSITDGLTWTTAGEFFDLPAGEYKLFVRNGNLTCEIDSTVWIYEQCTDTLSDMFCINGEIVMLNNYLNGIADTGTWNELSTSGALSGNELNTLGLSEGNYFFSYDIENNNLTFDLQATEQKYAGIPIDYFSCVGEVNLFKSIESGTFAQSGSWYFIDNGRVLSDSIVNHEGGEYSYLYFHESEYACNADSAIVIIEIDNEGPVINCDSISLLIFTVPTGTEYYVFTDNSILPKTSDNCGVASINNSWNDSNSLLNEKFPVETHQIKWIVTDQAGNKNECISVIKIQGFVIPNIFTPNGDGYNDTWDFSIDRSYPDAIIEIYDRGAGLIYVSDKGYHTKWDGILNGEVVTSNAYYYIIKNGEVILYKGSVTVLH